MSNCFRKPQPAGSCQIITTVYLTSKHLINFIISAEERSPGESGLKCTTHPRCLRENKKTPQCCKQPSAITLLRKHTQIRPSAFESQQKRRTWRQEHPGISWGESAGKGAGHRQPRKLQDLKTVKHPAHDVWGF